MKKILYIIAIVSLLYSCEKDKPDYSYNSGSYVSFLEKQIQDKESVSEIKIPILLVDVNKSTEPITVDFSFDETYTNPDFISAVSGTDFILKNETNTLTFEPGVAEGFIIIEPIDNLTPTKSKIIKININSNSKNYTIGMPGPDQLNSSCLVIIQEDDCPLTESVFSGSITGKETPLGQTWWTDSETSWKWEVINEVSPGVIEYNVTGFWSAQIKYWQNRDGIGPGTYYPVKVTIDVSTPSDPRYSIAEAICATCSYGDYYTKAVTNEPLPAIDVCGLYVEIPYTLNSGWPTGYTFNVKFQF